MKYGILVYDDTISGTNIGDYIQSLAAAQYFPVIDSLINREKLDSYNKELTKLIMNGWFTHHPEHWIPSDYILPLFVAFHINASHKNEILTQKGVSYLKKHSPIGCRDSYTLKILNENDIEAYYSGCLTLTLDKKYKVNDQERGEDIYIVDPLFNLPSFKESFNSIKQSFHTIKSGELGKILLRKKLINKIIDENLLKNATYIHHMIKPNKLSHEERLDYAEKLLYKYARAKLVITSRIHCALPCLALGTPVIFINSFEDASNKSRLEGLSELFNRIDVDLSTKKISANFKLNNFNKIDINTVPVNPTAYVPLANKLKHICENFSVND